MIKIYLLLLIAFAGTSVYLPLQGLVGLVCMTSILLRKHKLDEEVLNKRLITATKMNEELRLQFESLLLAESKRQDTKYEQLVSDVKLAQQEAKDKIASLSISKSYGVR